MRKYQHTVSLLTLKRPYWGRSCMAELSSMLFHYLGIEYCIYHQRRHLALFHSSLFKRQTWSSGEVKLFCPKTHSGRARRWSQVIWLENFNTMDLYSYALIFLVALVILFFKLFPFLQTFYSLHHLHDKEQTFLLKKPDGALGHWSLLPVFHIIPVWHRTALNASLFQLV